MIQIQKLTFNPAFQENTYVLWDETQECLIIDPGCYDTNEQKVLEKFIRDNQLIPKLLLNTHCHIDHVLGNYFIKKTWQIPLLIHPLEQAPLKSVELYAPVYGFQNYEPTESDKLITENDKIQFGNSELQILFTPGHSVGHIVFYCPEQQFCINGDVLFYGSIGRTDLPGGDHATLLKSIREVMFTLPDETLIYTGHGQETHIGFEKKYNPFLS